MKPLLNPWEVGCEMWSDTPKVRISNEQELILTSCLTAIKAKVIKYCVTVYERSGKNMFWPIKNSGEVLSKLKEIGY